ncbi:MAG: ribosomal-protein-alanine N-acetyltransferase [Nitrospirae bacterium]|nr:MAG: ribosomal-protein-alanine N-acetyltransferase [Nitrospirota bacterium]
MAGSMMYRVRNMAPSDIPIVAEIERNSFISPWSEVSFRSELENPLSECFVADADGDVIGYICSSFVLDEGHLLTFGVSPLWRRRGVGRRLLWYVLQLMRSRGVKRFYLEVRPSNLPALRLYESEGFQKIGIRRGYYSFPKEDAIVMMKMLSP